MSYPVGIMASEARSGSQTVTTTAGLPGNSVAAWRTASWASSEPS